MAGKILWSENAGSERLRMRALTGLVRRTPGKQRWLTKGAPSRARAMAGKILWLENAGRERL